MELWTIDALVVHRSQGLKPVVAFCLALDCIAVNAWCCGHVQPLLPGNELVVVDPPKVGFGFAGQVHTSSAVCLVANYQVEIGQPHLLRFRYRAQRLIRGKDHRHCGFSLRIAESLRKSGGIRRRGQVQVEERNVVIVVKRLSGACVGTHGELVKRNDRIVGPLPERLRQQRYRWREEQDAATHPCLPLGYAKCRERLAGAASHY